MFSNNNMMGQQFQSVVNGGQCLPSQPRIERVNLPVYFVSSANDIQPGDVSMTGDINLFVTRDLKRIYAKVFTDNGTITTGEFVLQTNNNQPNHQNTAPTVTSQNIESPSADILQQIMSRLDAFETRLNNQNKTNNYKNKQRYPNNHQKKEGSNNGT